MAKTLDEFLDEIDRWAEPLNEALDRMTQEERIAWLEGAPVEFEKETNTGLDLEVREAPSANARFLRSLEHALEEIAKLRVCMQAALRELSPEERDAFFSGRLQRFQERTGIKLNLRPDSSPRAAQAS